MSSIKWKRTQIDGEGQRWMTDLTAMPQFGAVCSDEVRWTDYQRGTVDPPPVCRRCWERIAPQDVPRFLITFNNAPSIFNRNCRHGPFCPRCVKTLLHVTIPFCALCKAVALKEAEHNQDLPLPPISESCSSSTHTTRGSKRRKTESDMSSAPASVRKIPKDDAERKRVILDAPSVSSWLSSNVTHKNRKRDIPSIMRRFDLTNQDVVEAIRLWCQKDTWADLDTRRGILEALPVVNYDGRNGHPNHVTPFGHDESSSSRGSSNRDSFRIPGKPPD